MDIDKLVEGLEPTVKSYLEFPKERKQTGTIIRTACDRDFCYVIIDQTIFCPETSEQEGDSGFIRGKKGELRVRNTIIRSDVIIHEGKMKGEFEPNEEVEGEIYWPSRTQHSNMHAIGHALFASILEIRPDSEIIGFRMSRPGFIQIKGGLCEDEVAKVAEIASQILQTGLEIKFVDSRRVCVAGGQAVICEGIIPDSVKNMKFRVIGIRGEKLLFDLE